MTRHREPDAPLVSVVMSVYNPQPEYFPLAVHSVMQQTLGDLELIIVEDPGPRSGRPMLAGMVDRRIRHIVNPARTSAAAQRNRALAAARGQFVAVLDADDIA